MTKKPKRPRDINQLARLMVDIATSGGDAGLKSDSNPMAALGRSGGLKGGVSRAKSLTPAKRTEIARAAAEARWRSKKDE